MEDALLPEAGTERILQRMASTRVLVVGDPMLDHYLEGDVERISPEAPVPVVRLRRESERWIGGGACNAALNIVSLGGSAALAGVVGTDEGGSRLRGLLEKTGVDTSRLVEDGGRRTTTKTRIMSQSQQLMRLDEEVSRPPGSEVRGALLRAVLDDLGDFDAVLFEDYEKGSIFAELPGAVIAAASDMGLPVVVDPKERSFFSYRGCSLFKPNRRESERALGMEIAGREDAAEACRRLLQRLECAVVLLTLGSRGSMLLRRGGRPDLLPTAARHVYDVSGAGDTVAAVMAMSLGGGLDPADGARVANFAAAAVCAEPGVYAVTGEDVIREMEDYRRRSADA
jgi:D-beta-D-heptose 7-phosphate kinase/D-beta-D-heptose 1-phosphate adenosyltransferase